MDFDYFLHSLINDFANYDNSTLIVNHLLIELRFTQLWSALIPRFRILQFFEKYLRRHVACRNDRDALPTLLHYQRRKNDFCRVISVPPSALLIAFFQLRTAATFIPHNSHTYHWRFALLTVSRLSLSLSLSLSIRLSDCLSRVDIRMRFALWLRAIPLRRIFGITPPSGERAALHRDCTVC